MPLTLQYLIVIIFAIVFIPLGVFLWRQWRNLSQKNIKLEQKLRAQEKVIIQTNGATALWQNKFNAIFQESLDAHLVINRKNGEIIDINYAAQKILGYNRDDLLGQHFSTLLFDGAALTQEQVVNSLNAYGTVFESQEFLHRDGSVYPMDLTAAFISWEKDQALLATLRDVTEREQLRSEIANQHNLLTLLMNNIPDSIFFKDVDGKFRVCNTATAEMMGVKSPDELLGKTDFDYLSPELARQNYEIEQQIIKSGTALINFEEAGLPTDSGVSWGLTTKVPFRDVNGNIAGIIGIRRDITERKKTELLLTQAKAALTQRVAQLSLIHDIGREVAGILELDLLLHRAARLVHEMFDYHHVALFLIEGDRLRMKAVSGSYESYFPPNHTQLLHEGINGWVATHGEKVMANDVTQEPKYISLISEHSITQAELCLPIKVNGQPVGVLDIQSPNKDSFTDDDVIALEALTNQLAVAIKNATLYEQAQQEVEQRKQIEEILSQQAQELSRSNADLEQFAYIVSHDLQEPLRMVTTYLKLLSQRLPDDLDPDSQDFIYYAVDGATRMRQLIQDLLAYSRVGTRGETPEPIECEAALTDALANLEAAIKESNATISYDSLPTLLADKGQLRQLFQNLIGNAIKFSPDGPPQIKISAQKTDDAWLISVQDNGIGIAEDAKERIFNVFQRLHAVNEYPGTGIGLAICKKIVQRHGGRIWVESTPGQGSTFYFTIPNPDEPEPNKMTRG